MTSRRNDFAIPFAKYIVLGNQPLKRTGITCLTETEDEAVLTTKAAPTLLAVIGSIDWLTTVVGIAYFGAIEGNPFIATLASTNLLAFTIVKLGTAFFVAFLFYLAERTLRGMQHDKNKSCKGRFYLLRSLQGASLVILLIAVLNNVFIIVAAGT